MTQSPRTPEEALESAYRYLAKRDRTEREVRARLRSLDVGGELIEATVQRLREQGYLDDARYAKLFAEDRRNLDGWGEGRIRRRLVELGIDREQAAAAARPEGPKVEIDNAIAVLSRRGRGWVAGDPRHRRREVERLVRRGYDLDVAHEAVRRREQELSHTAAAGEEPEAGDAQSDPREWS